MPNIMLHFPVTVHRCESPHPIQHFPQNYLYVSCWTTDPGTGVDSSLLLLVTIFSSPLSAAGLLTLAPVLIALLSYPFSCSPPSRLKTPDTSNRINHYLSVQSSDRMNVVDGLEGIHFSVCLPCLLN